MILASHVEWVRTDAGSIIEDADVEVRQITAAGESGALAAIFSNADGATAITQPGFKADSNGRIQFYAAPGRYHLLIGSGVSQITVPIEVVRGESLQFSPLSFGAVGDGTTDDRTALQAMIQYLADNPGASRIVDLGGRTYSITGYLYMGRFDWDQDGTYDDDTGPIQNVTFTNGAFRADPAGDWTSPWPETGGVWDSGVPSTMFYIGDIVNQSYVPYRGENEFDVAHITFDPSVTFECEFETGGVWIENTHRVKVGGSRIYDLGIDCCGVGSPQTVGSPRGYTPINQDTHAVGCRIEGNQRLDGIDNWPGKAATADGFNGGSEICFAQNVPLGALSINGVYTSGGEFTSDIDKPMFVAIQNVFDNTLSDNYFDFRDVTFTITGFADFAKTIPITEDMIGPRGGKKIEWSYSMLRYAVITSITSDTAVTPSARNQVLVSTDYRSVGVRMGTHDAHVDGNNFTALSYAAVISGRAGSFKGNHPWSRYVLFTDNSRSFTIVGNYLDFTTVDLRGERHTVVANGNKAGSPGMYIYPNKVDDTGKGLVVAANSFTNDAAVYIEDGDGGNNWIADRRELEYTIRDIPSLPGTSGTGYNFTPGFNEFGRGGRFNGYLEVLQGGGEFNGTLTMRGNRISGLGDGTDADDAVNLGQLTDGSIDADFNSLGAQSVTFTPLAAEPPGTNGTEARSNGTASTNGFGASGAGKYVKLGGSWSLV